MVCDIWIQFRAKSKTWWFSQLPCCLVCKQPQASPSSTVDEVADFLASDNTEAAYVTLDSIPTEPLATNVFLPLLISYYCLFIAAFFHILMSMFQVSLFV